MPCFDNRRLTTTWMCNIRLQAPNLARKCDISHWLSCGLDGQADGRTGGRTVNAWIDNQSFLALGLRSRALGGRLIFINWYCMQDYNVKIQLESTLKFLLLFLFGPFLQCLQPLLFLYVTCHFFAVKVDKAL